VNTLPQFLDLEQGSDEWHALRRKYRMASLAPAVMGECPYTTRGDVLRHYRGGINKVDPNAPPLVWGRKHETDARAAAAAELGEMIHPMIAINGEYGASLDGIVFDDAGAADIVVECKAPYKCEDSKLWKLALEGELGHYAWQVQHQLLVTQAPSAMYVVWTPKSVAVVNVVPDPVMHEQLREEWDKIMAEVDAAEERTDDAWCFAADLWRHKKRELAEVEAGEAEARLALVRLANPMAQQSRGAGVILTRSVVRGAIDYKAIPELRDIDLDAYRKPAAERVTITEEKT
jgi:putative phage-type endonuclease